MVLRLATADDYEAFTGLPEPAEWFGLASTRPHLVEGIGMVYRNAEDGRWWGMFMKAPGVSKAKTSHEGARRLLHMASERGIAVHAIPDPNIKTAPLWMQRLGFRPTDESIGGLTVWVLN